MKRAIGAVLALAMLFAAAACGSADRKAAKAYPLKTAQDFEKLLGCYFALDGYNAPDASEEGRIVYTAKAAPAAGLTDTFTVDGGKPLRIGISAGEAERLLNEQGWNVAEFDKDLAVNAGCDDYVTFEKEESDGGALALYVTNAGAGQAPWTECAVCAASFDETDGALPVFSACGVQRDSTVGDVIKKLGDPSEISFSFTPDDADAASRVRLCYAAASSNLALTVDFSGKDGRMVGVILSEHTADAPGDVLN